MKKLTCILLLLVAALSFTACGDGDPASDETVLQDVVMIQSMTSSSTVFAVSLPGSSEVAMLNSNRVIKSDDIEEGTCCLIRYTSPRPAYTSADIDLLGVYAIPNLKAATLNDEVEGYSDTPVYLISAWSFCNRVIMKVELPYPVNQRKFMLLLDPATADDDVPILRLIQHVPESTAGCYMKSYTVAFSLDEINPKISWKGVKICLNNSNLKKNVVNLNLQ